jgi:predicted transcriptional regulator
MPKQAMFTLKLESDLREQFMAEAEAAHRPASQIVRDFMRDFVNQQRAAREHDLWFRAEVKRGLREADDPKVKRIPHEEISAKWLRQRTKMVRRAEKREPSEG